MTYKTFKNKLTHIIRIAKKNYLKEKFDMHRNNGKKTWETISEILKNKNKKTTVTDTFIYRTLSLAANASAKRHRHQFARQLFGSRNFFGVRKLWPHSCGYPYVAET